MKYGLIAIALAAIAVVGYVAYSAAGPTHLISIGQPIRHDDFLFTVKRIHIQPLGETTRYDVSILVENQALRVPYHWTDDIAYVTGDSGRRYAPTTNGSIDLPPGRSAVVDIAFQIPRSEHRPLLRFWDGVFMGDALNGVAYAKARIALPVH